jgi:toxin ParE1/3/4
VAARSVQLRERAATDIGHAADCYRREASADVALRFIDAVERAVGHIARSPQSGSLRFAYELEIPDLRVRPIARFPYLVFYVAGEDVVDVWRVLNTKRDIPSAIADDIED